MKRVLVVEDDASTAEMLQAWLSRNHFEVHRSADGSQALELARKVRPDLLILDMMLPGMDGYTLQKRLSEQPETASVPIIVLTAQSELEQLFASSPNVRAFLAKPFELKTLQENVRAILDEKR